MPPGENPYESPRIPEAVQQPPAPGRHGWKFVLLGVAIAAGIVSIAPWLGVIFAIVSAPVFLRYFAYGWKRPNATPWDYAASQVSGVLGGLGFVISVLAAAGGTFFGVCSVTAWTAAFPMMAATHGYDGLGIAMALGVVAGIAAGITSLIWLIRFFYDPPPASADVGAEEGSHR